MFYIQEAYIQCSNIQLGLYSKLKRSPTQCCLDVSVNVSSDVEVDASSQPCVGQYAWALTERSMYWRSSGN